jgi:hypothetical protein
MATPAPFQELPDFSLVSGGPLYQMLGRAHLAGPTLGLLRRQVVLSVVVCWVPLVVRGASSLSRRSKAFLFWRYRNSRSVSHFPAGV